MTMNVASLQDHDPAADASGPAGSLRMFSRLTLLVAIFALCTMVLGPLVRAHDAGLACPDWPLCKGQVIPDVGDYQIFLEWIHRVVAAVTGIGLLAWLAVLFAKTELRSRYAVAGVLAALLMTSQIALGALTITEQLDAYVVKSHLLNAVLFLSVLVYVHRSAERRQRILTTGEKKLSNVVGGRDRLSLAVSLVFLVTIFLQLFLGGRVSTNYAGYVCPAFPACYYEETANIDAEGGVPTLERSPVYFPSMIGATEMHMTHRFMAYFLAAYSVALLLFAYRRPWTENGRRFAWFLFGMILLQILVGAVNVLYQIPPIVTTLHSTFAYIIYLGAFILSLELFFDGRSHAH